MRLNTKETKLNIPLTHMADIAYLLLIFIIIFSLIHTTNRAHQSLPVSTTGTESQKGNHMLTITENGFIFNNKDLGDITSLAAELKMWDISIGVTIIADKRIQFGKIKHILNLLKEYKATTIEFLVLKK